jgi:hypothetical protein
MATPDKAASLKRMKTLATALLVVVTLLFVVARREGWPWLAAFAEAAMIGALADWFAVVALFRHPSACRFPTPPSCRATRRGWPTTWRASSATASSTPPRWWRACGPPTRPRASACGCSSPTTPGAVRPPGVILVQSLDFMDDRRVRRLLVHALRKRAAGLDLAGAVGRILDALTENRRHQGLLDEGIRKLAAWLDEPGVQAAFAGMIVDVASKEYPKVVAMLGLVGMNPAELGDKVSVGIVHGVNGCSTRSPPTPITRAGRPSTSSSRATSSGLKTTRRGAAHRSRP